MNKKEKILLVTMFLFLSWVSAGNVRAGGAKQPKRNQGQLGKTIPKIIFPRLDGKFFSSNKLQGRVAVLNFWATWDPPCRSNIPVLIGLYKKYGGEKLEVIGIALDKDIKRLKEFAEEIKINYPIVLGSRRIQQAFGGIEEIPVTLLVDEKGMIRFRFTGYTSKEVLEEKINLLLRE